jgi:uncharacterized protein YeaO (DUF488 family)
MNNLNFYENGKIYKIVDNTNDNIYIGSTCKKLCQRIASHRSAYKIFLKGKATYTTSFEILKNGNYDIILIENYPCKSKEELNKRERYYIETINCCNKIIPTRTMKEWNEDNKDKMKEYYREYQKEYHKENKEKLLEYQKDYLKENKEQILEYQRKHRKEKINCICGSSICKGDKAKHEKTKKHTDYILKQTL